MFLFYFFCHPILKKKMFINDAKINNIFLQFFMRNFSEISRKKNTDFSCKTNNLNFVPRDKNSGSMEKP